MLYMCEHSVGQDICGTPRAIVANERHARSTLLRLLRNGAGRRLAAGRAAGSATSRGTSRIAKPCRHRPLRARRCQRAAALFSNIACTRVCDCKRIHRLAGGARPPTHLRRTGTPSVGTPAVGVECRRCFRPQALLLELLSNLVNGASVDRREAFATFTPPCRRFAFARRPAMLLRPGP